MNTSSFLTTLSSDEDDFDEMVGKEEEKEMMIQDPKLCEELDTLRREITSLEEIVRQKSNALEKIKVMIRKKESIYQRDKKKFMNTTGTWVADMNLKKMATKNTVMQKKLSSAKRKANMLQAQEIKIKLHIEDLRREKAVFEDAFKRMSKDVERLQYITENLQSKLSEAERDSSSASGQAKSRQDEYLEQAKKIQNQIRRLDKKIYNTRRKKKRFMSGKDVERDRHDESDEKMSPMSTLKKRIGKMNLGLHNETDITSLEYRKQWWNNIKEKTNIDSIDTLLNDSRVFEETKMRKLMEANKLILNLEKLREEKKIVMEKEQREEGETSSRMKRHADIVKNIRCQTKKKQEAMSQIMSQIEAHHSLAKSVSPHVTALRDIVDNKKVQNALGVSKMAFTSPLNTNSYSTTSTTRVASMKVVCENLGHLQAQIMLIMQFYTANLVDGKLVR